MRRGGTRRAAVTVAAVTAILIGLVVTTPATAEGTAGHRDRQRASFELEGALCPVDPDGEADGPADQTRRPGHQGSIRLAGTTEATIGLATGELTVDVSTTGHPNDGLRSFGRWELQPAASTGSIGGRVAVDRRGRATLRGWGDGPLAGARVSARIQLTTDDRACDGGLGFAGAGRASRRQPSAPIGAVQVTGTKPVADAVADLTAAIEANPNLTLVRTVDHQAAAASRGLVLGPTVELFFGNPNLGTPLMQAAQSTGIDLPQKILIWEDPLGATRVAYNAPAFLQSRHGIIGADAQLGVISNALAGLAGVAAGTTVAPTFDAGQVPTGAGLVSIESQRPPEEAFAAIVGALEDAPPINVAIVLEHDANAARVGLDLDPTKLVVFGNPSLGTGLMQTRQSIALDLPQKILVTRTGDGPTIISWNDPHLVAKRHGVTGQDDVLDTLAGALASFAARGQ